MSFAPVSVVVVSRHRLEHLLLCLKALRLQQHTNFEVVVVTDPESSAGLSEFSDIKLVEFDEENISKARNLGISRCAAEIIAFIDDDAVAEPTWLKRLTAPFKDRAVAAAGGFVRGRNGISYQWKAEEILPSGLSKAMEVATATVMDKSVKTPGTNCAFRMSVLRELSGFDENFHFYLDETDLNLRIHQAGLKTAIVPNAEVQHGFVASSRRGADRRPLSLYQIGASAAYFLKKHGQAVENLDSYSKLEERRLARLLQTGVLEPRDVIKLRKSFWKGVDDGKTRQAAQKVLSQDPAEFQPFDSFGDRKHAFVVCSRKYFTSACEHARDLHKKRTPSTVVSLSVSSLFHRRMFHSDGYWVQKGGIFGRSTRSDPLFKIYSFARRCKREVAQIALSTGDGLVVWKNGTILS